MGDIRYGFISDGCVYSSCVSPDIYDRTSRSSLAGVAQIAARLDRQPSALVSMLALYKAFMCRRLKCEVASCYRIVSFQRTVLPRICHIFPRTSRPCFVFLCKWTEPRVRMYDLTAAVVVLMPWRTTYCSFLSESEYS